MSGLNRINKLILFFILIGWIFLLIHLSPFLLTSVKAHDSGIEITVKSPLTFKLNPGKVMTLSILITNLSPAKNLLEKIEIPPNWRLITTVKGFKLNPGENRVRLISFYIPEKTENGRYSLQYQLTDDNNQHFYKKIEITILPVLELKVTPVKQKDYVLAGHSYQVGFKIINHSNQGLKIQYLIEDKTLHQIFQNRSIFLEAGGRTTGKITRQTDRELSLRSKETTWIRVDGLNQQIKVTSSFSQEIFPRINGNRSDLYQLMSLKLISGLDVNNQKKKVYTIISGHSFISEKKRNELQFRFNLIDRKRWLKRYSLTYQNKKLNLSVGQSFLQKNNQTRSIDKNIKQGLKFRFNWKEEDWGISYYTLPGINEKKLIGYLKEPLPGIKELRAYILKKQQTRSGFNLKLKPIVIGENKFNLNLGYQPGLGAAHYLGWHYFINKQLSVGGNYHRQRRRDFYQLEKSAYIIYRDQSSNWFRFSHQGLRKMDFPALDKEWIEEIRNRIDVYRQIGKLNIRAYYEWGENDLKKLHSSGISLSSSTHISKNCFLNVSFNHQQKDKQKSSDTLKTDLFYQYNQENYLSFKLAFQISDHLKIPYLKLKWGRKFYLPVFRKTEKALLKGKIVFYDKSKPLIKGLIVRVGDKIAVTDIEGRFYFYGLNPGHYFLQIANLPGGFVTDGPNPYPVNLGPREEKEVTIKLNKGANLKGDIQYFDYQVQKVKYGHNKYLEVKGRKLSALRGAAGIVVSLISQHEVRRTITDQDGHFNFVNLKPGEWELRVINLKKIESAYLIKRDSYQVTLKSGQQKYIAIKAVPKPGEMVVVDQGELISSED